MEYTSLIGIPLPQHGLPAFSMEWEGTTVHARDETQTLELRESFALDLTQ